MPFRNIIKSNLKKLDEYDAQNLYEVLLSEVVPTYYSEQEKWIAMMKASHHDTVEDFSAARMIDDYYQLLYNK